jgi:hypothetical protein
MTFLLPIGLLTLLTLPVIVILHLLRERRRRMAVPSLLHWQNIPRQREGERIRRLPLTLLLLLHLLVAGALGLALGRPQMPGVPSGAARQVVIVLDTSTSMGARDGSQTRFAEAQARARALLRELRPGDRAAIIAAGPAANLIAEGGAGDVATLVAALDRLRPGGDGADMAGALTLAQATLDPQRERRVVAISDRSPAQAAVAANLPADWQIIGDSQPNRAIISFAARPWGDRLQVYARAANYADAPFRTTLQLYGDEQLIDTRDLRLDADGETELTWTLPDNYARLRAELAGGDGQAADDQGYLSVAPAPPARVLLVTAKPDPLRRALAAARAQVTVVEPARYAETASGLNVDLTVFDGFLPTAWPAGAVLAINPPPGSPLLTVDAFPGPAPEGELAQRGAIFDGLSLGGVNFGIVQPVQPPSWATMQLAIGDRPLILRGRDGPHEIAIWSFDLASGNLPSRLAFPLLVARTMRDLMPAPLPAAIQAGAPLSLRPDLRATEIQVVEPDGVRTALAAAPTLVLDTLTQPGFYRLEGPGLDGQIGVNAGSAVESDLRQPAGAQPEGQPQFTPPAQPNDQQQRHARDIWPWLALGALALLMLEWGYIHR